MHITFYGATREVTGSMHLLATGKDRILLDCGLFQGRRQESERKNQTFPFDPSLITNVVLSHAHIDHSGRTPLLAAQGFGGRIICTRATRDASTYLLMDGAHIQESDALYMNYKTVKRFLERMQGRRQQNRGGGGRRKTDISHTVFKEEGQKINREAVLSFMREHHLEIIDPLYTSMDAQAAISLFDGYPYGFPVRVGKQVECVFYEAGHILGSAITVLRVKEGGRTYRIAYTGDIGRFDRPILNNPELSFDRKDRDLDLLVMESTYGDREHEPARDLKSRLRDVVNETVERGGSILIPAFAFGRTQELLYVLHELRDEQEIPNLPVYVDSPLATNLTKVFGEHPELYDASTHETFLEKGKNPFSFKGMHFVASLEASMALMEEKKPHIVLSASGMCEAGRVLHHLRHKIHDERNTILIVGYMAQHTLGRKIQEDGLAYEESGRRGPAPVLKFFNKEYPLLARVVKLGGFSAHADKHELLRFLEDGGLRPRRIAVVHGEEEQSLAFVDTLTEKGYDAFAPKQGEVVIIPEV